MSSKSGPRAIDRPGATSSSVPLRGGRGCPTHCSAFSERAMTMWSAVSTVTSTSSWRSPLMSSANPNNDTAPAMAPANCPCSSRTGATSGSTHVPLRSLSSESPTKYPGSSAMGRNHTQSADEASSGIGSAEHSDLPSRSTVVALETKRMMLASVCIELSHGVPVTNSMPNPAEALVNPASACARNWRRLEAVASAMASDSASAVSTALCDSRYPH